MVRDPREGLQYSIDKCGCLNKYIASNVECSLV